MSKGVVIVLMRNWLVAAGLFLAAHAGASTPVWEQFVTAKKSGAEPVLPDFSYAGYKYGEAPIPDVTGTVFDVTKYGAVANDEISDQPAIRAAIAAAKKGGGGIVFFPAGRFLMNTPEDDGKNTLIDFGNVVLRGSGMGEGGTVIEMVANFNAPDPKVMYSTPFLFFVNPNRDVPTRKLAKITADSRRETFAVTVDDVSKLKPEDRVTLALENSKEAVAEFLSPFTLDPIFQRMTDNGILVLERHKIKAIEGNKVIFYEPMHANVTAAHGWTLKGYHPAENFGVEDIAFVGNWRQRFVHHRSALDDGGWSMLRIENVANSWVRRCAFINVNQGVETRECAQISLMQLIYAGNGGHFCVHSRAGYGAFGGLIEDRAWFHHGPSVGYQSSGNVYWRFNMQPEQRIDSHSGQPMATLLDNVNGGILYGSGGPTAGMPNHLRYYTLWNFNYQGHEKREYDMWREGKKDRFLLPIVVGFHGTPVQFNEKSLELLEGQNTTVDPESLWESQLALRLGKIPDWVAKARTDWEVIRKQPLPNIAPPEYHDPKELDDANGGSEE